MDNVAQVLNNLLPAPDIKAKLRQFETPQVCAITGEIITRGYKIQDITLKSTNEFMDTYHGTSDGYVSEAVGRVMKVQNIGNISVVNGKLTRPMISLKSAKEQQRPCWSELVRTYEEGDNVLILITTDFKRRLWTQSKLGTVGSATPIFTYDTKSSLSGVYSCDWDLFLSSLDLIEELYNLGFSKPTIGDNLYKDTKTTATIGYKKTHLFEKRLKSLRIYHEFEIANLIAQKEIK